jgi:Protein involved in formate dehydrogenase formation
LLQEWHALLERRPQFREVLAPYGELLSAWASWPSASLSPLAWGAAECQARWDRSEPLLAEAPPAITAEAVEDLIGAALDALAAFGIEDSTSLERFAHAWDRADVGPADLLPSPGRIGSTTLELTTALSADSLSFLAGSLRPVLDAYFGRCREHLAGGPWDLGSCPFCGGPPGFADLMEDGHRRLACHLCGGQWGFGRLRCPYCGRRDAKDFVRLQAEEAEEGYLVSVCKACRGYLKEIDRRLRWNAGSALIEDWGSPHLDLVAVRAGYRRPIPTLVQLVRPR